MGYVVWGLDFPGIEKELVCSLSSLSNSFITAACNKRVDAIVAASEDDTHGPLFKERMDDFCAVALDATLDDAFACVRAGGTVSVIGVHDLDPYPLPLHPIM